MLKLLSSTLIMLLLLCSCVQIDPNTTAPMATDVPSTLAPTSSPINNPNETETSNELLAVARKFIIEAWDCARQLQENTTPLDPSDSGELQLSDKCRWEDYEHKLANYYSPDLYHYVMDNFKVFEVDGKCGYFKPNVGERYLLDTDGIFELMSHTDTRVIVKAPYYYYGVDETKTGILTDHEEMQQVPTAATYTLEKMEGNWKIVGIRQLFNNIAYHFKWGAYQLHMTKNAPLETLYDAVPYMSFYEWDDQAGNKLTLGLHSEDAGFTSITLCNPAENKVLIYAGLDTDTPDDFRTFYFTFQDDGYGNQGNGTISFMNGRNETVSSQINDKPLFITEAIKVNINITHQNSELGIFEGEKVFRYIENIFETGGRGGTG